MKIISLIVSIVTLIISIFVLVLLLKHNSENLISTDLFKYYSKLPTEEKNELQISKKTNDFPSFSSEPSITNEEKENLFRLLSYDNLFTLSDDSLESGGIMPWETARGLILEHFHNDYAVDVYGEDFYTTLVSWKFDYKLLDSVITRIEQEYPSDTIKNVVLFPIVREEDEHLHSDSQTFTILVGFTNQHNRLYTKLVMDYFDPCPPDSNCVEGFKVVDGTLNPPNQ